MPEAATVSKPVVRRGSRDAAADLARWPAVHLLDCPAATDAALAAEKVEFYREVRITSKKPPHDVTDDQRPGRAVMVAHCCLCGGMTYYDLGAGERRSAEDA